MAKEIITSSSNTRIKRLIGLLKKGKLRREEKVFVCEGKKMFLEVLCQFPERIKEAYFTEEAFEEINKEYGKQLERVNYELVSSSVFDKIAETVTPQGVIAIVSMPEYTLDDLSGRCEVNDDIYARILILDNLRDPGNLGTIVRTAEAAGMTGILLSEESVDVTNPKVVRSTMGGILRVPIYYTSSMAKTLGDLKNKISGFKIFASALDASVPYDQVEYGNNYGIVIGNESSGVSKEVIKSSDYRIHIPMEGKVESLNAAIAAAIIMYQAKTK